MTINMYVLQNGQDPTMGVNSFNETKILSPSETIVRNILLILLGRPGFYPSQPNLGMNIEQYLYMFADDINTNEIKETLIKQCEDLADSIEEEELDVSSTTLNGRTALIFTLPIIIDDKTLKMSLGVSTNNKGEFIYDWRADKHQFI